MFLYLLQMHETKKEKKDKKNDLLSNNKDKNLDNINKDDDEEIDVIKLLKNIKLPDHDTSNKKNEDNLIKSENIKIEDDNINISSKELKHGIQSFNNPSFSGNKNNSLGNCCKGICNCLFKKVDHSYFEDLDLHKSIIIIIILKIVLLLIFIGVRIKSSTEEIPLGFVYTTIFCALDCIYIFYKLNFNKYDENFIERKCCLGFHMFMLFSFKELIYLLLLYILINVIQDEQHNKIFVACFAIKILYLLYFYAYFKVRDGLIHYGILTVFGIVIMCISVSILLFFFTIIDVRIVFIICSIEMFFFSFRNYYS